MNDRRGRTVLDAGAAAPAIQLRASPIQPTRRVTRWHLILVIFMRLVALMWLAQGLSHWHDILTPIRSKLETLPDFEASALALFSVLDLVAAVGLWLVTPWGGVLWILAAVAQMAMIVLRRDFFPSPDLLLMIDGALMLTYLFVTYQAGQEERKGEGR